MTPGRLHADAVRTLEGWRPPDERQAALRADYLAVLAGREDAVWRTCAPAHLTASALVLDDARERVLLTLHAKVRRWLQMGGHCEDGDATLADAALREAREESGIDGLRPADAAAPGPSDLDRHPAPCAPGIVEHHLDVRYVLIAPPDAQPVVSAESLDVRWFDVRRLPADVGGGVERMIGYALAGSPRSSARSWTSSPAADATPSR